MKELKIKAYRGKCEPIIKGKLTVIKMYGDCLEANFDYHYKKLNKDIAGQEIIDHNKTSNFVEKTAITAIDNTYSFHPDDEAYENCPVVILYVTGVPGDFWIRCETVEKANELYKELVKWRFNIDIQ